MTLLERSRTLRPVTWLAVIGVILLPVLVGAVLVVSLYNPTDRLGNMTAAIVNNDKPVTLNGQTVPLGRQLTAGLVEGSKDLPSNLNWVISNTDDAASGLADGTYAAVITIPDNFSAAATSTAPGGTPEKATISIATANDAKVVDSAITAQIAQTATSVMGQQLSQNYVKNVLLGFTTLNTQLGQASSGAEQLATGAATAASGAAALPSGIGQLASGANQLTSGANQLSSGAGQLASGLETAAAQVASPSLNSAAATTSQYAASAASQTTAVATTLGALAQECAQLLPPHALPNTNTAAIATLCEKLGTLVGSPTDPANDTAIGAATAAGYAAGYASGTQTGVSQLTSQTSAGLTQSAAAAHQLQSGASGIAAGSAALASGATQASSGATQLVAGVDQLATGASSLSDGLKTAVSSIPTYSDTQAATLADVVANPVTANGVSTNLFGGSAIPLLSTLVLWFGSLATFVVLQAVSRRALASRLPSVVLALRSFAPAAVIGALQGVLVAIVVQIAANYDTGSWLAYAGLSVVAGIAFAAVNQALVALFRGTGRLIAAIAGTLAIATSVVSTTPSGLTWLAGLMPTAPAYNAALGVLASAGGVGSAVAGMVVWTVLGLLATTFAVWRHRTSSVRAVVAGTTA
ncbi:YhgE/Pip family protein [Microbacteriaceae bacterium K1510]|uniref:YhgE/Pip family protein n=1 Tax=Microbacterium sp. 4NA327F11 TaxID=2502229 RepID=UPI0010FA356D|nr:YhgE/Pip family protein [Microbacterium sp. 4NA327F11]MCK9919661.1 YhgE/Pip family protein [Microbacteriaceae bacterium K1510]